MLPAKFRFIWPNSFKGEDSLEINQSETRNCLCRPCLSMERDEMSNLYRGPEQTWLPQAILVSDWLISKISSPLKPLGLMNRNLVGSILGRSSIKIAFIWPSDFRGNNFLEINQSETRIACGSHVC
jgi:hypothetical protein